MTATRALMVFIAVPVLAIFGCQADSRHQVMAVDKSQVELRAIQSRAFETNDRAQTVRTVIATLQDLGFVIDKADQALGVVSGTKLAGLAMRMTVTVRPRGEKSMLVRGSAQYHVSAVSEPEPYQQFFAALEKAMFLTAQQVD